MFMKAFKFSVNESMPTFNKYHDMFYESKDKFLERDCTYVLIQGEFDFTSQLDQVLKDKLDQNIKIQRVSVYIFDSKVFVSGLFNRRQEAICGNEVVFWAKENEYYIMVKMGSFKKTKEPLR